jgi:tetratricopeptide (TPR) repeat protein
LALEADFSWKFGDISRARKAFELAANHQWQFQGGHLLLRYGDFLVEHGNKIQAKDMWQRCISQDPECFASAIAKKRLE